MNHFESAQNYNCCHFRSLIVTGIDGLCPSDLTRITRNSRLEELAVVGELINPSVYAQKEAAKMLSTIENLLIQVGIVTRKNLGRNLYFIPGPRGATKGINID